jgi:hypothetical protein
MVIDGWPIDSHHKELVGLINELHSATTEGRDFEVI